MIGLLTNDLITVLGGDGNQDNRRLAAESLEPGSQYQIKLAFTRIGPYPGSNEVRERNEEQTALSTRESEGGVDQGKDQETRKTYEQWEVDEMLEAEYNAGYEAGERGDKQTD